MRRRQSAIAIFLLAVILAASFSPSCMAYNIDSLDTALTDEISKLVEAGDIPSLQICIVSGEEKLVKGFGEQTDEDTVFLIGSIQKVFVAVAILQLYDEGLIGLDDDLNMYMPFSIRHPEYPNTPITIRMLLAHRSGLDTTLPSEFAYDWAADNPPDWTRSFREDLIGLSLEDWLEMNLCEDGSLYSSSHWVCEPDSKYSYSNVGYKTLMCLLERVTGMSIQDYMDEHLFTPLQMDHTGFDSAEFMEEHAIPYTRKYGNDTNIPLPVWNGCYMLRSSASDMGNLMMALMNDGLYKDTRILEAETVELMTTNTQSSIFISNLVRKIKRDGYGLGMGVYNHGILGHTGSTVGFTGELYYNPVKEIGFVRISNVNAILDYTSEGWRDIGDTNRQISSKLLQNTGLVPPVDYILLFPITGIIIVLFSNRRKILDQLKTRFDVSAKNTP